MPSKKISDLKPDDKECKEWRKAPVVNPITNRPVIYKTSNYNEFEKHCGAPNEVPKITSEQNCLKWIRSDKKKNPLTGRDFSKTNPLYKEFVKNCKETKPQKMTLYDYQREHIEEIKKRLEEDQIALNTSEMGTGKTLTSTIVAKELDMSVLVICPIAVRQSWIDTLTSENVNVLTVTNYESIKGKKKTEKTKGSNPKCYKGISDKKEDCKSLS